ncbi:MAG: hypothetical protein NXY57DRAFT_1083281 [Lentinula lateritia]|nr:MAG: hypothetical protein NXY57DRAFT_1083281 [Lentinula lateritia]
MSNEFYTVFPASRAVDDFPPIAYHIHQGHRVPAYRLGWVVTVTEAEELLGPAPEGRDVINYYSYDILPSRWGTTQAKSDLQPPDLMLWRYETGQHKEELITRSIEAIGLTSEMREKVKCRMRIQESHTWEDFPQFYQCPEISMISLHCHRVPGYFLGWVVTVTEAEKLLGPAPEDEDTIEYYSFQLLPSRWEKTKAKSVLKPPDLMLWSYETGCESQHKNDAHFLLYVAHNSTEDLKMVNEHKEELITRSIEAFGFTSERQEKVKWYRLK